MRLMKLSDADVLRVLAFVMAESLEAGTAVVEALGSFLQVDMADYVLVCAIIHRVTITLYPSKAFNSARCSACFLGLSALSFRRFRSFH